jgi:hypothetical protein
MQFVAHMITGFHADVREWSRGRHWPVRLLLLLWLSWLAFQYSRDAAYGGLVEGLNLGVHEFGHLICSAFGQFVTVLGGSLVQCLVPLISFVMFYRQEDYFAFSFSLVWLGTNLNGVARYVADARSMQLDLVSPFGGGDDEVIHDWNWILAKLGWLQHDHEIATVLRVLALVCLWAGVAWGACLLWRMMTTRDSAERYG